jgi:hypothetical protein
MSYYIYDTAQAPAQLKTKYPHAAQYLTATLFVEGIELVTGIKPDSVVDLTELTLKQLDAAVDQLFAPEPPATGAEVLMTKVQGNYIYINRFKQYYSESDKWPK